MNTFEFLISSRQNPEYNILNEAKKGTLEPGQYLRSLRHIKIAGYILSAAIFYLFFFLFLSFEDARFAQKNARSLGILKN